MNKTVKFLVTTFIISWISWGLLIFLSQNGIMKYGQGVFMLIFIIGGNGPFIAALILKKLSKEDNEYSEFKHRLFKWNVNPLWYAGILISPILLFMLLTFIHFYRTGAPINILANKVYLLLILIWINIIGGGLEEVGWRGVLLPNLMERYSILTSILITSIIWAIWHLPLWFIVGASQQSMSFIPFTLMAIGFSFLLTSVYVRTKSILLCVLLHSIINSSMGILYIPFLSTYLEPLLFIFISFVIYYILTKNKDELAKE